MWKKLASKLYDIRNSIMIDTIHNQYKCVEVDTSELEVENGMVLPKEKETNEN